MVERYRDMDLLHPDFRILVDRLLSRCVEAGVMVMVVETWRSQAAHEEDVANGRSWVKKSKHQNTFTKKLGDFSPEYLTYPASLAIDIAPYEIYQLKGPDKLEWDADDPIWQRIGEIGESLGMKWGGRFKKVKDYGHFEASWA